MSFLKRSNKTAVLNKCYYMQNNVIFIGTCFSVFIILIKTKSVVRMSFNRLKHDVPVQCRKSRVAILNSKIVIVLRRWFQTSPGKENEAGFE